MEEKEIIYLSKVGQKLNNNISDYMREIGNTSFIIFFNAHDSIENPNVANYINSYIEKGFAIEKTIDDLEDEDLCKFVLNETKKYATSNADIVFLRWDDIYDALNDELEKLGYKTYKVRKIKEYKVQKMKSLKGKPTKKPNPMGAALAGMGEDQIKDTQKINQEERNKTQNKTNNNNPHVSRGNANTEEVEETTQSVSLIRGNLEKQIFIDVKDVDKDDGSVSELSYHKGQLVDSVFERIKNSLQKYIKDFDKVKNKIAEKDYYDLIIIILSSENFKEFETNWQAGGSQHFKLAFNDESFLYIKDEAIYFHNLSDMLFEKDKWG